MPIRVILDVPNISEQNLKIAVEASIDAGVSGIQTGNGFGRAVTATDVLKLVELSRGRCSVNAAGGLQNLEQAFELIDAGASRIGTSRGPELIKAFRKRKNNFV